MELKCLQNGSKVGDVGAAGILFVNGELVQQLKLVQKLKFKLHAHCSNNQAEQIAIVKALEK
jgi:ribonuclease HI